jgi:hypothetical protein
MNLDQILQLTDGNLVAAHLLKYLCQRHDECVRHLPPDAKASIIRPYTADQLWQALDCIPTLDGLARAIALLHTKQFIILIDHPDPCAKWFEVLMPNIGSAIEFIKIFPPQPPTYGGWEEIEAAINIGQQLALISDPLSLENLPQY